MVLNERNLPLNVGSGEKRGERGGIMTSQTYSKIKLIPHGRLSALQGSPSEDKDSCMRSDRDRSLTKRF